MGSHNRVVDGYIEENEAIEVLAKLTGREITVQDMRKCASQGIVPAYAQFMPMNKDLYNWSSFYLVWGEAIKAANLTSVDSGCEEDFWKILPFPLPADGLLKATDGIPYRVLVSRNDGLLEAVSEQHYIRVYADQEVRQAAKNVKRYLARGDVRRMTHSCCQTWEMDRDHDQDLTTVWFASPFTASESAVCVKAKAPDLDEKLDPRERRSLYLMIAALAQKAGYPLENPSKAEAQLKKDLDAMGIFKMNGKGTAQGHFEAAALVAEQARQDSEGSW